VNSAASICMVSLRVGRVVWKCIAETFPRFGLIGQLYLSVRRNHAIKNNSVISRTSNGPVAFRQSKRVVHKRRGERFLFYAKWLALGHESLTQRPARTRCEPMNRAFIIIPALARAHCRALQRSNPQNRLNVDGTSSSQTNE
jgi:hypothetical protein